MSSSTSNRTKNYGKAQPSTLKSAESGDYLLHLKHPFSLKKAVLSNVALRCPKAFRSNRWGILRTVDWFSNLPSGVPCDAPRYGRVMKPPFTCEVFHRHYVQSSIAIYLYFGLNLERTKRLPGAAAVHKLHVCKSRAVRGVPDVWRTPPLRSREAKTIGKEIPRTVVICYTVVIAQPFPLRDVGFC